MRRPGRRARRRAIMVEAQAATRPARRDRRGDLPRARRRGGRGHGRHEPVRRPARQHQHLRAARWRRGQRLEARATAAPAGARSGPRVSWRGGATGASGVTGTTGATGVTGAERRARSEAPNGDDGRRRDRDEADAQGADPDHDADQPLALQSANGLTILAGCDIMTDRPREPPGRRARRAPTPEPTTSGYTPARVPSAARSTLLAPSSAVALGPAGSGEVLLLRLEVRAPSNVTRDRGLPRAPWRSAGTPAAPSSAPSRQAERAGRPGRKRTAPPRGRRW